MCLKNNSSTKCGVEELQRLYQEDKLKSAEGYLNITNIIKSLLMRYLIKAKGGYYKEGIKQTNFDLDDVNDCFHYIMDRIYGTYTYKLGKQGRVKYDPTKMNLASFVHTWTIGYCSQIRKKAHRRYNRNFHKSIYLEDVLDNRKTPNNYIEESDEDERVYNMEIKDFFNLDKVIQNIKIENDHNLDLFLLLLDKSISLNMFNKITII